MSKEKQIGLKPDQFKVSGDRVFYSLQGEGVSIGEPATFLRLHLCNLQCSWCFSGNTLIQTPRKKVKIKNIKKGDEVLSFDGEKVVVDEVVMIYKRKVKKDELLFIKLDKTNEDKIFVTKEHEFFVKGKWVKAKDLNIGNEITCNEYRLWRMLNNNPMKDKKVVLKVRNKLKGKKSYKRTEEHRLLQRIMKLGNRNPRYVNGKRSSYLVLWKKIRSEVLERDNYICQNCGNRERLEVHHIIPYRISKDNSLENLITLCKSCHLRADNQIIFHNGITILDIKEVNDKQMARLDGNKEWCYVYNLETRNKNYFAYNLLVHNCDTPYTWNREMPEFWDEMEDWSIEETAKRVEESWECQSSDKPKRLVITGGEPLLQRDKIDKLMDALPDWKFEIETNGTMMPTEKQLKECQINCSPKLENSGNPRQVRIRPEVIKAIAEAGGYFKFVVAEPTDLDEIERDFVEPFGLNVNQIILMPLGTDVKTLRANQQRVAEAAKIKGYRLLGRLQIDLWGDKRRT